MILELISLLLIRTSSSLSLALTCLYSLYSSAMGVRSSFCTFLMGVKADHEDFCNRKPPSAASLCPPTRPTKQLLSSTPHQGTRPKQLSLERKKIRKKGQKSCSNKVWDNLSTIPQFQILLETCPASLKSPALQKSMKTLQKPSECQPVSLAKQNTASPGLAKGGTYMNRHTREKKGGIWSACSWLTGEFEVFTDFTKPPKDDGWWQESD